MLIFFVIVLLKFQNLNSYFLADSIMLIEPFMDGLARSFPCYQVFRNVVYLRLIPAFWIINLLIYLFKIFLELLIIFLRLHIVNIVLVLKPLVFELVSLRFRIKFIAFIGKVSAPIDKLIIEHIFWTAFVT